MILATLPLVLMAAGPMEDASQDRYRPSGDQERVDRSISDIPIEANFEAVRGRLECIAGCNEGDEAEWQDGQGTRYHFWGGPGDLWVVIKRVDAADFAGPIPALEIGAARERSEVLAAAKNFIPGAEFQCTDPEPGISEECQAFLDPGWVTIRFDASGRLIEVRLDGYHFT